MFERNGHQGQAQIEDGPIRHGRGWRTPAGLAATAAVAMVPLALWSFQVVTDLWPAGRPGQDYE